MTTPASRIRRRLAYIKPLAIVNAFPFMAPAAKDNGEGLAQISKPAECFHKNIKATAMLGISTLIGKGFNYE